MEPAKPTHPIDVQVGQLIRARRKALGISQGELAGSVAVTFQQVQKYESGKNRVSASKLYEIARELRVPVEHFFGPPPSGIASMGVQTPSGEITDLLTAFAKIDREDLRQTILTLVRSLALTGTFSTGVD